MCTVTTIEPAEDINTEEGSSNGSDEEEEEEEEEEGRGHTPADVARASEDRSRFGCTCGRCIEGLLSPRMVFALECQADTLCDIIREDVGFMTPGNLYLWWEHSVLENVPEVARRLMRRNKSMWIGMAQLFGHVADCLRSRELPTDANVSPLIEFEARKYLDSGGTVNSVVLACFEHVFNQSNELGDGTHHETFHRDIAKLPACKNDQEYKMARKGYQRFDGVEHKKWWRDTMPRNSGY